MPTGGSRTFDWGVRQGVQKEHPGLAPWTRLEATPGRALGDLPPLWRLEAVMAALRWKYTFAGVESDP